MDAYTALKQAANTSGVSLNSIGRTMGKPDNYVSNGASRGSSPQANTLAAMAEVCDYALVLLPRTAIPDAALVIDPTQE